MLIHKKLVPPGLATNPNKPMREVRFVTIHNTGSYGATATARNHANYQYAGAGGRQASWHYTVDDAEIWQSFLDSQMCWHAGDGNGPGNAASVGVEICVNRRAEFPKACYNAAWLTAKLLRAHGLDVGDVRQHFDWSGKNCPAELRSGAWGVDWDGFLRMVRGHWEGSAEEPPVPGVKHFYRVQIGAFQNRAGAETLLREARDAGFEGFVVHDRFVVVEAPGYL